MLFFSMMLSNQFEYGRLRCPTPRNLICMYIWVYFGSISLISAKVYYFAMVKAMQGASYGRISFLMDE